MRPSLKAGIVFSFLIVLILSCTKPQDPLIPSPGTGPTVFTGFAGMLFGNKEYFWNYSWQKASANKNEMKIDTWRLTDSAINRVIKVYVAIFTDWSVFEWAPSTRYDPFLPDTVNLSYTMTAGHLKLLAKAPFQITWASDTMIEYQ